MVSGRGNPIIPWDSLGHRESFHVWFLRSIWYYRLVTQDFIALFVCSWKFSRERVKLVSYSIFYFNKVCSCKILACGHHEVLLPWPRDSLP